MIMMIFHLVQRTELKLKYFIINNSRFNYFIIHVKIIILKNINLNKKYLLNYF